MYYPILTNTLERTLFTGIVEKKAELIAVEKSSGAKFTVKADKDFCSELKLGDSISINGACQTVTELKTESFSVFATSQTLDISTLGSLKKGSAVNIERAMRADSRFDGHIVSGHVDAKVRVISIEKGSSSINLRFELPKELAAFVAKKGSVAIDGVSLTVYDIFEDSFSVVIIPFTAAHTTIEDLRGGDFVNLETDILAKYTKRILGLSSKDKRLEDSLNNFLGN